VRHDRLRVRRPSRRALAQQQAPQDRAESEGSGGGPVAPGNEALAAVHARWSSARRRPASCGLISARPISRYWARWSPLSLTAPGMFHRRRSGATRAIVLDGLRVRRQAPTRRLGRARRRGRVPRRSRSLDSASRPGLGGSPSRGQRSSAIAHASWTASSARLKSPTTRIRQATERPDSSRKIRAIAAPLSPAGTARVTARCGRMAGPRSARLIAAVTREAHVSAPSRSSAEMT
jgi:hypothetical protein